MFIQNLKEYVLVTEGKYDFYAFQMFKPDDLNISFLPSTGAEHIQYNIPILLASDKKLSLKQY